MDPIYITTKETASSIRIITKPGSNSRSKPIAVPIVAVRANREVFIIVVEVVNQVISKENWSFDDFWQLARIDVVASQ